MTETLFIPLADLISAGENTKLEFKSTLRMNLHTGKPDTRMELSVLKSIAGFLNSQGGTLIIGCSDDGEPMGLDADQFSNEDKMHLHLVNILKERIGTAHMMYIDEAHRGMNVSNQERQQATSIVQKFIVGSPSDNLPPANLVIGMSATPDRFNAFLQGTRRTTRPCDIDPADVRASGLIKDRIILHPKDTTPSPWTLLAEACRSYSSMCNEWAAYCGANSIPVVAPALIVQIEDGNSETTSQTNLETVITTLEENIAGIVPSQIVIACKKTRYWTLQVVAFDMQIRLRSQAIPVFVLFCSKWR